MPTPEFEPVCYRVPGKSEIHIPAPSTIITFQNIDQCDSVYHKFRLGGGQTWNICAFLFPSNEGCNGLHSGTVGYVLVCTL